MRPRHRHRSQQAGGRGARADDGAEAPSPPPWLGDLPPRDAFLLNQYTDIRHSQCPRCEHRTWRRKVPLLLFVAGYGPLVLGKAGPYCSNCRLLIIHRDELEGELVTVFTRLAPEVIGGEYAVLGTVELRAWREGMSTATTLEEVLHHTAAFTTTLELEYTGGGWAPDKRAGPRLPRQRE